MKIKYEIKQIKSLLHVTKREELETLVRIFTIDDCFTPDQFTFLPTVEKEKIEKKINEFIDSHRLEDGSFQIIFEDDFFVIK